MYQHQVEPFGKFEKHTITNPKTGNSFSFVPEHGACLLNLRFGDQNVVDGYQTAEELDFNRWNKNMVLYPYPNRLRAGTYEWEGKTYHFPINDPGTNNSIHGLGIDKPMRVNQLTLEAGKATIGCTYEDGGQNPAYPFPFSFSTTYQITDENTFSVTLAIINKAKQDIPVGLGWHPYFQVDNKVDKMSLQLPACELIGIDNQMLPTGKRYDYPAYKALKRICSDVLDNCFAIKNSEEEAVFVLQGAAGTLTFRQDKESGAFQFFQVFTPHHRNSLALEPMTCNIDALNNGEGLIRLAPGETGKLSFLMEFSK